MESELSYQLSDRALDLGHFEYWLSPDTFKRSAGDFSATGW